MDSFCIHGISAIIERTINGENYILIQDRQKGYDSLETGLIEIPCGKVKEEESVFDCLRKKVLIETGLHITKIYGEKKFNSLSINQYNVINYIPFFSTQNIENNYPIVIETFICDALGETFSESHDAKNIRWISIKSIKELIKDESLFYPMIVMPIKYYLEVRH